MNVEAVKIALELLKRVDLKGSEAQAFIFVETTFANYVKENDQSSEVAVDGDEE